MQSDINRVLIDREKIANRIEVVAKEIIAGTPGGAGGAGGHNGGDGPKLTLVPILTGSIIFVADLIRHLPLYLQINVMSVSSYPGTATTAGEATVNKQLTALPESFEGTHVLLVDDILDSGQTLRLVTDVIKERNPGSVRTCVLLRKERPEAKAFACDHVCFDIPDEFVVGYGLDYNGYYRNLPDIVTLTPEAIESHRSA